MMHWQRHRHDFHEMDPVDWSSFQTAVHDRRRYFRVYLDPRVPCPNNGCKPHKSSRLYMTYLKGQRFATLRCSCKCLDGRHIWNGVSATRCAHWCQPLPLSDEQMCLLQGDRRTVPRPSRTAPLEDSLEKLWASLVPKTPAGVPHDAVYSIEHAIAMTAFANHFNPAQENARQADVNPSQRREMAEMHQKRQDAAKRVRE
jgi:hypothetical protein